MRLEMFDDQLIKNQAILDYEKSLIDPVAIFEFSKGPYEFSPKLKNYSLVCFWTRYA